MAPAQRCGEFIAPLRPSAQTRSRKNCVQATRPNSRAQDLMNSCAAVSQPRKLKMMNVRGGHATIRQERPATSLVLRLGLSEALARFCSFPLARPRCLSGSGAVKRRRTRSSHAATDLGYALPRARRLFCLMARPMDAQQNRNPISQSPAFY